MNSYYNHIIYNMNNSNCYSSELSVDNIISNYNTYTSYT